VNSAQSGQAVPRRTPSGAAVLQDDVTAAVRTAVFAELAAVGYGRLSIEGVARRAKVGKPAIYRRWPSKQAMVVALVSEIATVELGPPDTGSLRGDIRAFLEDARQALAHPLVRAIAPDLLSEANRNPDLAQALIASVRDPRRIRAAQVIHQAIERGELRAHADVELALDFLAGPLYWRAAVVMTPSDETYLDRLTTAIAAAIETT
jgi:AcrR family transcriptional regulator